MKPTRSHVQHHDPHPSRAHAPTSAPASAHSVEDPEDLSPRQAPELQSPVFIETASQVRETSSVRFLARRKLRQIDVDGRAPMALVLNGRVLGLLQPGHNAFEPPLQLEPGDVLLLEVLEPEAPLAPAVLPCSDPHVDQAAGPGQAARPGQAASPDRVADPIRNSAPRSPGLPEEKIWRRPDAVRLARLVDHPPCLDFRAGDGHRATEALTRVATIDAPWDRGEYLREHGVDLTFAEYNPRTGRWERCLLSEGVADLLEQLCAEGGFPYPFEAAPSHGELEWLEARARGATERPVLPLSAYLVPGDPERLAALALTADTPSDHDLNETLRPEASEIRRQAPAEMRTAEAPRPPAKRIFAQIQW